MASKSILNPNAAPFPFLPRYFCYQATPHWSYPCYPYLYQFNFNSQPNCYAPVGCGYTGKGIEVVEDVGFVDEGETQELKKVFRRKVRKLPPSFRCKRKLVFRGKEKPWLPKELSADGTRTTKKEMEASVGGKTSLMIRNIPNQFQRQHLLQILDNHCLEQNKNNAIEESAYDFLYLPMDFKTGGNFGYAFVNFTNCFGASRFCKAFDNLKWDVSVNRKTCKICFAKIQGKVALANHFRNSLFCCSHKDYLPVVLSPPSDGVVQSTVKVIGNYRKLKSWHGLKE